MNIENFLYIGKAYAQQLVPCADGTMADPSVGCVKAPAAIANPETGIPEIILNIASAVMAFASIACVILLIYGGMIYATAAGDNDKISKAKKLIFWGIIGFLVSLSARYGAQAVLQIVT